MITAVLLEVTAESGTWTLLVHPDSVVRRTDGAFTSLDAVLTEGNARITRAKVVEK